MGQISNRLADLETQAGVAGETLDGSIKVNPTIFREIAPERLPIRPGRNGRPEL